MSRQVRAPLMSRASSLSAAQRGNITARQCTTKYRPGAQHRQACNARNKKMARAVTRGRETTEGLRQWWVQLTSTADGNSDVRLPLSMTTDR
jgi:hypothetical protein